MTTNTSPPSSAERVRLEGVLHMVDADGKFILRLHDGRTVSGCLVGRPVAGLAGVLGRKIIMFGVERFDLAGELEEIEVNGFLPNDGQLWARQASEPPLTEEVAQEMCRRQRKLLGAWPGDETDAELLHGLKELG